MEITPSPFGKTLVVGEVVDGAISAEREAPLPFDDLSFVLVYDTNATPEMIGEYYRVLKYNGKLSISVRRGDEGRILREMAGFRVFHREEMYRGDGVYLLNLVARKT